MGESCDCYVLMHGAFPAATHLHPGSPSWQAPRAANFKNFIEQPGLGQTRFSRYVAQCEDEAASRVYHSIEPQRQRARQSIPSAGRPSLLTPRTHRIGWLTGVRGFSSAGKHRDHPVWWYPNLQTTPASVLGRWDFVPPWPLSRKPRRAPTLAPISSGQSGLHFPWRLFQMPGSRLRPTQCRNTQSITVCTIRPRLHVPQITRLFLQAAHPHRIDCVPSALLAALPKLGT